MKITIWLRNDKDKTDGATLRLDVKDDWSIHEVIMPIREI